MRRRLTALLFGIVGLVGSDGCDQGPLVVVAVSPLPPDAASLYVSLTYRSHPARRPAPITFQLGDTPRDQPATFGVRLDPQTDGDLVVGAGALDSDTCLLAFGSGVSAKVSATPELAVQLQPAPVDGLSHDERCLSAELTPLLLGVTPSRGSTAGGDRLVLRGWGFGTDNCSQVSINAVPALSPFCRSLVEMSLTTPPGTVGPAALQILNHFPTGGDRLLVNSKLFSYYASEIRLAPRSDYPAGAGPVALATGLIDNDTLPDLVALNRSSGTLTVLLNSGLGDFPASRTTVLPAGVRPTALAVGDLDGDGAPDVLVTSGNDRVLSLFLQSGRSAPAVFASPRRVFLDLLPSGVAVADLDGDKRLDAAVTDQLSSDVTLLVGDGMGGLGRSPRGDLALPREPVGIELADLDGNGRPDVVVRSETSASVSVLLAAGFSSGGYTRIDVPLASPPVAFAVADLDGDSRPEVVVAGRDGMARILWNDGSGRLVEKAAIQVAPGLSALAAGDLDLDGNIDLVAASASGRQLYVLRNTQLTGARGLQRLDSVVPTGSSPAAIVVADFNGDHLPDVAVADSSDGTVGLFMNQSR